MFFGCSGVFRQLSGSHAAMQQPFEGLVVLYLDPCLAPTLAQLCLMFFGYCGVFR